MSQLCSRCGKNVAVVFITKMDRNGHTTNEGLCIQCAREMHIKPVDDIMKKFGITDDQIDDLAGEAMGFLQGMDELDSDPNDSSSDSDNEGKTWSLRLY